MVPVPSSKVQRPTKPLASEEPFWSVCEEAFTVEHVAAVDGERAP